MKKILITLMAVVFVLALALPIFAGNDGVTGNGAPPGPSYTLNIVGVDNPKKSNMTDSNRRTIFVKLGEKNKTAVETKIYLYRGPDFNVCDGNGFDPAIKCNGEPVGTGLYGAVFQLPCNNIYTAGGTGTLADPVVIPCTDGDKAVYSIWARALGQPGGKAVMTTCATDPDFNGPGQPEVVCSLENTMDVLQRDKGPEKFQDVTIALTSLLYFNPTTGRYERVALFASDLEDWFWKYDNQGLKLAQLRFYLQ